MSGIHGSTITRRGFLAITTAGAAAACRAVRSAGLPRPAEILLMRHAEKNERDPDVHLDAQGRARADALVTLFPARFAVPDVLFASRQSKVSNHAIETVEPIARTFHLRIDDTYADRDYQQLAAAVLSRPDCAGRHVLICWHHETLPQLALSLGATPPAKWPDKQYDHLWQVRYPATGASLTDIHEHLFPTDRLPPAELSRA